MATFAEFARQLLQLRDALVGFRGEIERGKVRVPVEWKRYYRASLGVIANILNDLRNLAPDLSNFSEIMERVKYRLGKLEEHINALTAFAYDSDIARGIATLKTMADELERKVASPKQQAAQPQPAEGAARPQQVFQPPSESEIPRLFSQLFTELGNLGENLKQAFQTKVNEQKEVPKEWLEQVKVLINESYDILNNIFAEVSEALRQFANRNYHAASGAMGRVNANLENLKERWVNLRNLGLNLGEISRVINLSWSVTGGINRIIHHLRQQQQRQGAVLRKYLILKFILERL
jgi:signal recognition particle subunit SEC65